MAKGIKEAERIAKEIGGHIPERVVDDGLLTPRERKENKYITIPIEKYEDSVRDAGYYQGLVEGLEKQLEELKRPEETVTMYCEGNPYIEKRYFGNVEYEFLNAKAYTMRLKGELKKLYTQVFVEETPEKNIIQGKIEGIEYAIGLIEGEKCEK